MSRTDPEVSGGRESGYKSHIFWRSPEASSGFDVPGSDGIVGLVVGYWVWVVVCIHHLILRTQPQVTI